MGAGSAWSKSLQRRLCVVLHGLVRRACALGVDPRSAKRVQNPGSSVCTDLGADPQKILCWFVMRWQLEVTFQEVRRHLGFETQRQWSEMAIRRTTPALLGLFSLITLFCANSQMRHRQLMFFGRRPATTRFIRPSPTRSVWCAKSSGLRRLFAGRPRRPTQ